MRRRPSVSLWVRPSVARPGEPVEVDFQLKSGADTPVDAIDLTLRGRESLRWDVPGAPTMTADHVALVSRHGARTLTQGTHDFRARFPLPADAPPSYPGRLALVQYTLELEVRIPWWPDLRKRFVLPVGAMSPGPEIPTPTLFSSDARGPERGRLYMEVSLDRTRITPGGVLSGAVSVHNTRAARIKGVELNFVALENPLAAHPSSATESRRYYLRLCKGPPAEGAALPFRVKLPEDAPASFRARLFELRWVLDVTVAVSLGDDVGLRIPVTVAPRETAARDETGPRRALAPVGRDRRTQLWAAVAQQAGVAYDADSEQISTSIGAVHASLRVAQSDGIGAELVATLAWQPLGLDVRVDEAGWVDMLAWAKVEAGDAAFDKRFTTRGRERAQVLALLNGEVRASLGAFARVSVDDSGATLTAHGAGQSVTNVQQALAQTLAAARAFDAAIAQVPVPAKMERYAPAWRAFAGEINGRFEPGRVFVHDGMHGLQRVTVGTVWARGAEDPEKTVLNVPLEPTLPLAVDLETDTALAAPARTLARELAGEHPSLVIGPDAIALELPGAVENPGTLLPLIDRLARLARLVTGRTERGPFR